MMQEVMQAAIEQNNLGVACLHRGNYTAALAMLKGAAQLMYKVTQMNTTNPVPVSPTTTSTAVAATSTTTTASSSGSCADSGSGQPTSSSPSTTSTMTSPEKDSAQYDDDMDGDLYEHGDADVGDSSGYFSPPACTRSTTGNEMSNEDDHTMEISETSIGNTDHDVYPPSPSAAASISADCHPPTAHGSPTFCTCQDNICFSQDAHQDHPLAETPSLVCARPLLIRHVPSLYQQQQQQQQLSNRESTDTCTKESATILYNMALVYHMCFARKAFAIDHALSNALTLYEMAYNLGTQVEADESASQIVMASLNNLGYLCREIGDFDRSRVLLEDMSVYILSLRETDRQDQEHERQEFMLNAMVLRQPPAGAAAA